MLRHRINKSAEETISKQNKYCLETIEAIKILNCKLNANENFVQWRHGGPLKYVYKISMFCMLIFLYQYWLHV